ncbi:MAG: hypothetical protein Q4B86_04915 [Eubacteriales bacterium]|nr:hypothetical protein [Eubacteriales bacterium]
MGAGNSGKYIGTKGASTKQAILPKSNIQDNAKPLAQKYGLTSSGYFGEKGKNCRVIVTDTPENTSIAFYKQIAKGGHTISLNNKKGTMTVLDDETRIVHRLITSTKGSPAIEITISGSPIVKDQKIHFIKEEK